MRSYACRFMSAWVPVNTAVGSSHYAIIRERFVEAQNVAAGSLLVCPENNLMK